MMKPTRTPEEIRQHYELEKKLAARLRSAKRDQRRGLYSEVYDTLYREISDHPTLHKDAEAEAYDLGTQVNLIRPFVKPSLTFMEIGPGGGRFSIEVAKSVKKVYALDVSKEVTSALQQDAPPNLELVIFDGVTIPLPANSVDLAYSHNQIEHLHPDDAIDQLSSIRQVLTTGGMYICVTTYRSSGPHDISKSFDPEATGFHLKEYLIGELVEILKRCGFSKVQALLTYHQFVLPVLLPVGFFARLEALIETRFPALNDRIGLLFMAVKLVATK
jgi:SAM-dependent methyltransferase